jgi:hypothetical protein
MRNMIAASFAMIFVTIFTCGKKGLDEKDNEQEKKHHENFRDSSDTDSSVHSNLNRSSEITMCK